MLSTPALHVSSSSVAQVFIIFLLFILLPLLYRSDRTLHALLEPLRSSLDDDCSMRAARPTAFAIVWRGLGWRFPTLPHYMAFIGRNVNSKSLRGG